MEYLSLGLILLGIYALCQSNSLSLYSHGLEFLLAGWIGYTVWSHRRPVRPKLAEGNPQWTIEGHPPIEVTLVRRGKDDNSEEGV